jgi:hypothetical protein
MTMKTPVWLIGVFCAAVLAGCGAEVATTAATSAAIKKQEIEAAKQTKDMVDKKIDAAAKAIQQRTEQQDNATK